MNLQERIGQAIVQLRKQKNLSQEQLALQADIDRRYMSDIENGKRNVSIDILERISKVLEKKVSELLVIAEKITCPRTLQNIQEWVEERSDGEAIMFRNPEYLGAILGITDDGRLVYSYQKMVQYLVEHEGMTWEEAQEDIDFNAGRSVSFMGEKAPIIINDLSFYY